MIDFDIILNTLGGLGRYQIFLVICVSYYSLPSGFNSLAPVFINYKPAFRCNVPPFDNKTKYPLLTEEEILNYTTPFDLNTQEYDTCYRYAYNLSLCNDDLSCVNTSADTMKCDMGYHYDTSLFSKTVITEFDLVCDQAFLDPLATSFYMIGVLLGSLVAGAISDMWGRKPAMISSAIISFLLLLGCTWVHNFWLFVVCRTLLAFFGFIAFLSGFVYGIYFYLHSLDKCVGYVIVIDLETAINFVVLEVTSSRWRTVIGMGYQIMFSIGYMVLSGIAYEWRNWHEINFATAIISLPYAIFLFFIPESPRWLFASGKNERGKEVTRKIAKYNKVHLDEVEIWKEAENSGEIKEKEAAVKSERSYSLVDLFRTRGMRITSFKVMFNWFVNSMVYYGISLNAGALAGDIFLNNTLNGVMEIAAYLIVIIFMDYIGRRFMLVSMMSFASLCLICSTIVNEYADSNKDLITLGLVFGFAAKVGISGSYAIIYNLTSELYPTVVRSNGIGVASTTGRIGSILAPFIIALQNYVTWLPNIVFGILAAIAAAMSLSFPETSGKNMLESIEEAELFYAGKQGYAGPLSTSTKSKTNSLDGRKDSNVIKSTTF